MIIGLASPRPATSLDDGLARIDRLLGAAAAQGAEIVTLVPLLIVLGAAYGAKGGAGAFVIAACVFAAVWTGIVYRLRRERRAARAAVTPTLE